MKSRRLKTISELEEKLPRELLKDIFTFFNQKELRTVASVNKNFNQLSKEEIQRLKKKYKDNIFYTVGNPIHVSNPKRSSFWDMDLWIKLRDVIPAEEIYASFLGKNIKTIRLFNIENEALEFSRFLRTGNQLLEGTEVYQPAVFKVIYLGDTNKINKISDDIIINPNTYSSVTEWNERTTQITYFETDRHQVIPLEGILKFHMMTLGNFMTYGPVDYSKFNYIEDNDTRFAITKSCTIN